MDGSGAITLEAPGLEIAERIYRRHKLLTPVFCWRWGVSAEDGRPGTPAALNMTSAPKLFDRLQAYVEEHLPEP